MSGIATYDPTTTTGTVRLLIPDRDIAEALFDDDEIAVFLALEGANVLNAAALAVETIASNEVMVLKVIRMQDMDTDGAAVGRALMARAAQLRERAVTLENLSESTFDLANFEYAEPVTWLNWYRD